ncbi:MAG: alpha/beta hydrolase [Legionellaceae bacterium]|nr:alpha/beta hydrolase [Legionellaceae bacterium]
MLKHILIVVGLTLLVSTLLIYIFQRHLIYSPSKEVPDLGRFHATDMSIIHLHTADNLKLYSWYKPAQANQPTILFLHGNAGHIGFRMPLMRALLDAGFGVLLLEYRGYGGNKGSPTEGGLYIDAETALQFLVHAGLKPQQIVVFGESLGTAVATKIAVQKPFCAVILQSPLTALAPVARYHYPWIFIKPRDRFNSLERIKQIKAPILIIHGKLDPVIPFSEGLTLFNQANNPKEMLQFDDKHHNDLWNKHFYEEIIHFIQKSCTNKGVC